MRIERAHKLGVKEARKRVDKVARDLQRQYSLTSEWHGDTLSFRGTGVKGDVQVTDRSVRFNLHLGFALMLMERQIRSTIEKTLDDHVG